MLPNTYLKTDLIFQRYKTYEYSLYYILKFSFSSTRLKPWAFSLTKFCNQIQLLELFQPEKELKAEMIDYALDRVRLKMAKIY